MVHKNQHNSANSSTRRANPLNGGIYHLIATSQFVVYFPTVWVFKTSAPGMAREEFFLSFLPSIHHRVYRSIVTTNFGVHQPAHTFSSNPKSLHESCVAINNPLTMFYFVTI